MNKDELTLTLLQTLLPFSPDVDEAVGNTLAALQVLFPDVGKYHEVRMTPINP